MNEPAGPDSYVRTLGVSLLTALAGACTGLVVAFLFVEHPVGRSWVETETQNLSLVPSLALLAGTVLVMVPAIAVASTIRSPRTLGRSLAISHGIVMVLAWYEAETVVSYFNWTFITYPVLWLLAVSVVKVISVVVKWCLKSDNPPKANEPASEAAGLGISV